MWILIGIFQAAFLLLCLPYMIPLVINLITGANTQLVTDDWKNRAYEKYNCLPQEIFSCQKWNIWCIYSSLSTSAPLKRHQSFMWAEHDAAAFLPLLCSLPPSFISTPNSHPCVCRGSAVTAQLHLPLVGWGVTGCCLLLPVYRPSNAKKDTEQKAVLGFSSSSSVLV